MTGNSYANHVPIHSAQLKDTDSIHGNFFLEHSSFSFEHAVSLWKFPQISETNLQKHISQC